MKSVYPSALGSMQVSELRLIIAGMAVRKQTCLFGHVWIVELITKSRLASALLWATGAHRGKPFRGR